MYIESEDMHLLASADSHELACHVGTRVILDLFLSQDTRASLAVGPRCQSPRVRPHTHIRTHPHALSVLEKLALELMVSQTDVLGRSD